ncbi:hypothetical protein ACJDT4_13425 [Clostridium neuense]|uniref:Uncharacterized protein n=1 Tax=Clostridium neuense TaxID=1728934 RepID=A0ABW8TFX1_9CLOT
MSNNTLFMVIGISGAMVVAIFVIAYLSHKGINILNILEEIKSAVTTAKTYTEAAETLTTGKTREILQSADAFEKLALQGVRYAEQMLLSQQIKDDPDGSKRKAAALDYIYAQLQLHGVKVDDNVKLIANGIVENTVLSDKTIDEINKKIDDLINTKVAALQSQVDSLTNTNNKLAAENQSVNEKLANIIAQTK